MKITPSSSSAATTSTVYLTTILSLLTLLAQSKPLPLPPPPSSPPIPRAAASTGSLYVWQATDFSFGCGSAACGIGFNVTAPAGYIAPSSSTSTSNPTTSPAPAFDVQCGVQYGVSAPWTDCTPNGAPEGGYETSSDSKVQVRWDAGNGTAPPYRVRVSHTWYDGAAGARWNATGEGSSAGAADFEVRGTRLVGEVT